MFSQNLIYKSFLFIVSLFFIGCQGQSAQDSAPPIIPVEKLYLEEFKLLNEQSSKTSLKDIDSNVVRMMQLLEIKGASVAICKDGRLVYAKGFGYADEEQNVKVQPYHVFRLASVSKLITAVAIMKLVEERKLSLDDKVFGEKGILNDKMFLKINDPRMKDIEVMHLLQHTGGWRNRFRADPLFRTLEIAQYMKVKPPADINTLIQFMLSESMIAAPGDFYDYSNFGYCVLGKVIEKKSGLSYEQYVQQKILKPIGVNRIRIGKNLYNERYADEVKYYDYYGARKKLSIYGTGDSVSRVYGGTNIVTLGAAGGWVASPKDLLKLVLAIDGFKTKPDILNEETISKMVKPSEEDSTAQKLIGWRGADKTRWWRTGNLASSSVVVMRQNDGISWVMITNTGNWKESRMVFDIMAAIDRGIKSVKEWPDYDLYNYK